MLRREETVSFNKTTEASMILTKIDVILEFVFDSKV